MKIEFEVSSVNFARYENKTQTDRGKNAVHTIENNYIIGFSFEDFNTLN